MIRSNNSMARFLSLIISALFLITLSTGCKGKIKEGKVQVERPPITGITIQEVSQSSVVDYYETSGTVKAKNIAIVSSRMMGEVRAINVKEGDTVRVGQELLAIDDRDIAEKIKAAEAGYKEAIKGLEMAKQNKSLVDITYQRYKKLHDEKALSQQELDQIETKKNVADLEYERAKEMVNRAKAGYNEAMVYQGYTKVTAPFSGVVAEKKIDKGSMAVPGSPLFIIEDTSSYQVVINVDERFVGLIKKGAIVNLSIDSLGLETKGIVSEVTPSIDPMTRTFIAKIDIKAPQLRSGLYARIKILVGKRETIMIPLKAIVEKGQLTGAYVVNNDGIVTFRPLKTGKTFEGNVEIPSGLNKGEKIVAAGVERVIDGGIIR